MTKKELIAEVRVLRRALLTVLAGPPRVEASDKHDPDKGCIASCIFYPNHAGRIEKNDIEFHSNRVHEALEEQIDHVRDERSRFAERFTSRTLAPNAGSENNVAAAKDAEDKFKASEQELACLYELQSLVYRERFMEDEAEEAAL